MVGAAFIVHDGVAEAPKAGRDAGRHARRPPTREELRTRISGAVGGCGPADREPARGKKNFCQILQRSSLVSAAYAERNGTRFLLSVVCGQNLDNKGLGGGRGRPCRHRLCAVPRLLVPLCARRGKLSARRGEDFAGAARGRLSGGRGGGRQERRAWGSPMGNEIHCDARKGMFPAAGGRVVASTTGRRSAARTQEQAGAVPCPR